MDTASHSGSMVHAFGRNSSIAGDIRSLANHSMADFSDLIARNRRRTVDETSDTSSQQERKFANLLGGENDDDEIALDGTYAGGGGGGARNVGHRLYREGTLRERAKEERLQEVREHVLLHEMAQLTQRPSITARARQKPGKGIFFSDHAMVWSQKKEENRIKAARKIRAQQQRELTGTPQIDRHSAEIVETSDGYVGPIRGWESHFAKFCAKRAVALSPQMFSPNINANAVRVDVDKSITDRLYDDSKARRDRLRERAVERAREENVDPATGRPLFTPQALRAPSETGSEQRRRSAEEVSEHLYGSRKEREERLRKLEEKQRDTELTFSPAINKKSAVLGEKVRKPLYTPNMRRPSRSPDAARHADPNATGRPLTNHSDAAGNNASGASNKATQQEVEEFLRRNERCDHVRQAKLDALRRSIDERDTSECTFQPRINAKSEEIFRSTNVYGIEMPSPTVVVAGTGTHQQYQQHSPAQAVRQPRFSASSVAASLSPPPPPHQQQLQQPQYTAAASPLSKSGFSPVAGGSNPYAPPTSRATPIAASGAAAMPQYQARSPAAASGGARTPAGGAARRSLSPNHPSPPPMAVPAPSAQKLAPHSPAAGADLPPADEYITNFERQMYAVLDEWRKLEEI